MSNKTPEEAFEELDEIEIPDKEERDYSKERDERCEPIASEVLQILADKAPDPTIGRQPDSKEVEQEERKRMHEEYAPIAKEVLQLCLDKNLQVQDVTYVFKILHGFVDHLKQKVQTSTRNAVQAAEYKLWGKDTDFLTLQDIEGIINPEEKES